MTRMKVGFVDRRIREVCYLLGVVLDGPPEIGEVAILVVDRFHPRIMRPSEKNGTTAEEGLAVIPDVAESLPYQMRDTRLPTEPRERRSQH